MQSIRVPSIFPLAALAATLLLSSCASPSPPPPAPLLQSQVDTFLKSAQDPRALGIVTYTTYSGKPHFQAANRPHLERACEFPFVSPSGLPCPAFDAKTGSEVPLRILIDTTSRQSWLALGLCGPMSYRPFKPPTGEYPDHVRSPVPGYAGAGNKLVMNNFHVEWPVFCVPMASGHLGPLARPAPPAPGDIPLSDKTRLAREKFRASVQAVMGCEMLREFSWIRIDFPRRSLRISSSSAPYKPPVPEAVAARIPLRDWQGRPAIAIRIDGAHATAVLDTAGDFEISLPASAGPSSSGAARIQLGDLPPSTDTLPQFIVPVRTHADLGLPPDLPPRVGLRLLARYAITLDYKTGTLWIEDPELSVQRRKEAAEALSRDAVPVRYEGVLP